MNTKPIECPGCDGFGYFEYTYTATRYSCPDCNGSGKCAQLVDDDDIRDTAGFDGFDSHNTYDDWRQP